MERNQKKKMPENHKTTSFGLANIAVGASRQKDSGPNTFPRKQQTKKEKQEEKSYFPLGKVSNK